LNIKRFIHDDARVWWRALQEGRRRAPTTTTSSTPATAHDADLQVRDVSNAKFNGPRLSAPLTSAPAKAMAVDRGGNVGGFCQRGYHRFMSTMNISLPESLKSFVDEQVAGRGFGTSSEYVRELIRKDQDRERLRGLLLKGANSKPSTPADSTYFASLRERVSRPTQR
jgi:antitoxin ParD1/3/4